MKNIIITNKRTSKINNYKFSSDDIFTKMFFGKRYLFIITDIENNIVSAEVFSYDITKNNLVETYHGFSKVELGGTVNKTIINILKDVGKVKVNKCLKKAHYTA